MKTKCEPGDKLKFPDGADDPKMRIVCKCCTPRLPELIRSNETGYPLPKGNQ